MRSWMLAAWCGAAYAQKSIAAREAYIARSSIDTAPHDIEGARGSQRCVHTTVPREPCDTRDVSTTASRHTRDERGMRTAVPCDTHDIDTLRRKVTDMSLGRATPDSQLSPRSHTRYVATLADSLPQLPPARATPHACDTATTEHDPRHALAQRHGITPHLERALKSRCACCFDKCCYTGFAYFVLCYVCLFFIMYVALRYEIVTEAMD